MIEDLFTRRYFRSFKGCRKGFVASLINAHLETTRDLARVRLIWDKRLIVLCRFRQSAWMIANQSAKSYMFGGQERFPCHLKARRADWGTPTILNLGAGLFYPD
jgi:hypothetical protein